MNNCPINRDGFDRLADEVCTEVGDRRIMLSIHAESSDFVRFNRNMVRQATRVDQLHATLSVVDGARRLSSTVSMGPNHASNSAKLLNERRTLIAELPSVPKDPHLLLPNIATDSCREQPVDPQAPGTDQVIADITTGSAGSDMVGFYASGPSAVGFADNRGQRNWHQVHSFHFDWSLYVDPAVAGDRAVKSALAGRQWDSNGFAQRMQSARSQLEPLSRSARRLDPGQYRVYLAPAAVNELLGGMAWSGFARKERENGTSSLTRLANGETQLNAAVSIREATETGIAPAFTETGLVRPERIELVQSGLVAQSLVSMRSAAEFGEVANAGADESPHALVMDGGNLDVSDAMRALDTGIWIANLWYLNYSDRPNGRMTGMTRFACFWVERGELVAPIAPMRFDESLLRLFGDKLVAMTYQTEFMPDPSTWGARHLSSITAPGILVDGMTFTL